MFKRKDSLNKNDVRNRINYLLSANFFTLEEFISLPKRKALKVLKIIYSSKKLKRHELKEVYNFIILDFRFKTELITEVFEFVLNYDLKTIANKIQSFFNLFINTIFNYRLGRFELQRF